MRASELIQQLQDLIDRHGDHEVEDSYGEPVGLPEYNDEDSPVIVLCDKA